MDVTNVIEYIDVFVNMTNDNNNKRGRGRPKKVINIKELSINNNKGKTLDKKLMSLSDKVDSFTESIIEEIRNENMKRLWDKYGKAVSIACVTLIFAVGAYNMWRKSDIEAREAISSRFVEIQSMITSGETEKALSELSEIGAVKKKEYAVLAKLEQAAILLRKKDEEAIDIYKSIYEDNGVSDLFRDLSYILYANAFLEIVDDKAGIDEIPNIIDKLLGANWQDGPWGLMAKETLAFCYMKKKDNQKAYETFDSLAKTEGIPADMLNRCRILMQSIER